MSSILAGGAKSAAEKPSKIKVFRLFLFLFKDDEIKKQKISLANSPSANGGKIEPKILLMDKAVVTLLIRSFLNNEGLFANCAYTISCYIIAVQEVVALKGQKYHLYLSKDEYSEVLQSLIRLKNSLIAQGRYTDAVDDILCKVLSAKKRKFKIKYI